MARSSDPAGQSRSMAQGGPGLPPSRLRRESIDCADTADSGLEDDPVTSSAGDLRSLGDLEPSDSDLRSLADLQLSGTGRELLEVPVQNAAVTAQLRQFLRAIRSPQQRRRAAGAGTLNYDSPVDGSDGGLSRSPVEGRTEAGELEFDWWGRTV